MCNFKMFKLATLSIVLLLVFFCGTSVYADDTNLGRTPNGVFPMQENDVIMESEEITVDLEKNSAECIFVFHNTGKSKNVYMGFPGKLYDVEDELSTDLELHNFKTFVKGKELPITREKSVKKIDNEASARLEYSEYFTFTVPFKENEKIIVRNTYDFTPPYDSIGDVFSGYVLKTGAMWKGPIGSAKVTFKLGNIQPYQIEKLSPGRFKFVKNELIWERNNFEPKYDLELQYNKYHYSEEFLSNLVDEENLKQQIKQEIASYKKVWELASKEATNELLALYNKAVKEKDSILALYIRSYLPSDKLSDDVTSIDNATIDYDKNYGRYFVNFEVSGPEAVLSELRVSHFENGNEIQDEPGAGSTSYYLDRLTPGIEYTITYTLTDWLDGTQSKTIKYKAPEQSGVSPENQTEPSVLVATANESASATVNGSSDETASESEDRASVEAVNRSANGSTDKSVDGTMKKSANETADESVNEPRNELGKSQNSNDSKLIVWVLSGVVLLGLLVVAVVIFRKKRHC